MIPIIRPYMGEEEVTAVKDVILSGWVTQGPKCKEFEGSFASYVGSKYACAVSSCTTALHMALLTVGVKPGDIVITVSHSFIATANAVRYCFAEPVFVDIDIDTLNLSVESLKECIESGCEKREGGLYYKNVDKLIIGSSPLRVLDKNLPNFGRIAAILVVHQVGMPCDMNGVLKLSNKYNIPIVEDAACAIGSEITFDKGKTWEKIGRPHGDIACFSFHPRKILTTGDGGMLTTNIEAYEKNFRFLRQHGMNISDLSRHRSKSILFEEYSEFGYNYRLTDIQAALGIVQLKKLPEIVSRRREIADIYIKGLSKVSWLKVLTEPEHGRTNWQSFCIRLLKDAPLSRNELMQYLLDNGISTRTGIMNSHLEKQYCEVGFKLKNSELARETILILPLFHSMENSQIEKIIEAIVNV